MACVTAPKYLVPTPKKPYHDTSIYLADTDINLENNEV